jgi:hypothetical protein
VPSHSFNPRARPSPVHVVRARRPFSAYCEVHAHLVPGSRRRSAMRTAFATPAGPPRFFKNLPGGPGLRLQALLADREMRKHLARRESGAGTPAASHSRPSWVSAMNLRVPSLGGPLGQSLPAGSGMP